VSLQEQIAAPYGWNVTENRPATQEEQAADIQRGQEFTESNAIEIPKDEKGRVVVSGLTERQMAAETLQTLRNMSDALEGLLSSMESHPLLKGMFG
jgi:hypothetical protein